MRSDGSTERQLPNSRALRVPLPDDWHQCRDAKITLAWGLSPKTEFFFLRALREGRRAAPYPVPRKLRADLSWTWGGFATSSPHLQRSASSSTSLVRQELLRKARTAAVGGALRSAEKTDRPLRAVHDAALAKFASMLRHKLRPLIKSQLGIQQEPGTHKQGMNSGNRVV